MCNDQFDKIKAGKEAWLAKRSKTKDRPVKFETVSSLPIKDLYTPEDIADLDYMRDLNYPGEYPYTRGVQTNMYRGACGLCASLRALEQQENPTGVTNSC